jgi:hypothetical protein
MSDFDIQAAADRLFPSSVPSAAPAEPVQAPAAAPEAAKPATAPQTPTAQAPADQPQEPASPEIPDAIRELRDTVERRMYSAQKTFASVELQVDGAAPELVSAATAELREMLADTGASVTDAREFMELAQQTRAATPEARASMRAEAIAAVRERYRDDADAALADAQALAARDPRVANVLRVTGIGDHPKAVLKFIELARSTRARGQL